MQNILRNHPSYEFRIKCLLMLRKKNQSNKVLTEIHNFQTLCNAENYL